MNQSNLPAGPSGRWLPTLKFIKNPRKMLEQWRDKYGDPFYMHALNGPLIVTGREDLIREIHGADPGNYEPFATQTIIPILGPGTIFSLVGADHRRERKLLTPMFHGDRMRAYGSRMCEMAFAQAEQRLKDGAIEILPLMTDISFGVIVQNIIGGTSSEQTESLVKAAKRMIQALNPMLFFSQKSHVSVLGLSPWDRFSKARQDMYQQMHAIIADRRASTQEHDDILSLLCSAKYEDSEPMSDSHICDELVTFLFAGHETTALSMTWAMYHLHTNPNSLAKLQTELDSLEMSDPSQIAGASYLKACVMETLRVHPIVTEVLRKLKQPMQLGEYTIPAGFAVAPATVLAHYNPVNFPEPDSFSPERFIDKSFSPFVFMPFGGGHRRCIGAAFATYEMMMVLATLLHNFQFELLEHRPVVPKRKNVTMGPSTSVRMRISRRKA